MKVKSLPGVFFIERDTDTITLALFYVAAYQDFYSIGGMAGKVGKALEMASNLTSSGAPCALCDYVKGFPPYIDEQSSIPLIGGLSGVAVDNFVPDGEYRLSVLIYDYPYIHTSLYADGFSIGGMFAVGCKAVYAKAEVELPGVVFDTEKDLVKRFPGASGVFGGEYMDNGEIGIASAYSYYNNSYLDNARISTSFLYLWSGKRLPDNHLLNMPYSSNWLSSEVLQDVRWRAQEDGETGETLNPPYVAEVYINHEIDLLGNRINSSFPLPVNVSARDYSGYRYQIIMSIGVRRYSPLYVAFPPYGKAESPRKKKKPIVSSVGGLLPVLARDTLSVIWPVGCVATKNMSVNGRIVTVNGEKVGT